MALHRGMVTPLWQQHHDHPHEHRQQRPTAARAVFTQKILSTTPHFQRYHSCPGLCVPSLLGTQLSCCPGQALSCRSEDTMGHSSAANMCPCDDFGNRNGLKYLFKSSECLCVSGTERLFFCICSAIYPALLLPVGSCAVRSRPSQSRMNSQPGRGASC